VLRSIILKGVGIGAIYTDVFFLIAFAAIVISVSVARMKKQSW
jgi:hypothetical protein